MTVGLAPPAVAARPARLALHDPRWATFVAGHPAATIFHHPTWAGLLAACYGYPATVVALEDDAGTIVAGLPLLEVRGPLGRRRWVSLPYTDHCPPLAEGGLSNQLVGALAAAATAGRVGSAELRAELPPGPRTFSSPAGVRHVLDLDDRPEAVLGRASKMHRRNVRKAERAGVRVVLGRAQSDLEAFYGLHLLTRRRLGVPIQPRRFFDLLGRQILEPGLGFVLRAELGGRTVASAVFLAWNGVLVYKYGASDQRAWEHRPNNLLFSAAIRWACEHGYRALDWGRTDLDDVGLREFKSGWGAAEEPLHYSTIARAEPRPGSGRLRNGLGAVIRRSPPWVCRVVGELFYRYAA